MTSTIVALAIMWSPPMGIYTPGVTTGPNVASLEELGDKTLTLEDGKHRAKVMFSVSTAPIQWPGSVVVGPWRHESGAPERAYRMISKAEILVDGCRVAQPWPEIQGMSMPTGAVLFRSDKGWGFEISGPGDGAEDYNVRYTFDRKRVLTRELRWGPDYFETTSYDIQIDTDVNPQECGL